MKNISMSVSNESVKGYSVKYNYSRKCMTHTAGDWMIHHRQDRKASRFKANKNMQEPTFIIEVRGRHFL